MEMVIPLHPRYIAVGRTDGVAARAVPVPESTTRESGEHETPIDFGPVEVTHEPASPGSGKIQQAAQESADSKDTDLRGVFTLDRTVSTGTLAIVATINRAIGARIGDRAIRARQHGENYRSLDFANKQLAAVCSELDAASRDLEAVLGLGVINTANGQGWSGEQSEPGHESIRRVKRNLPEPRPPTESAPTMGGQP